MSTPPVAAGRSRAPPPYGWDRPTRTPHGKDSPERSVALDAGSADRSIHDVSRRFAWHIVGHHVSGSSTAVRNASSASGVDSISTVSADDLMAGGRRGSPERGSHQAALRGVPIRRP